MAIINVTPDSFYEASRNDTVEKAIARAFRAIEEGADILDIGGESTRPGAAVVSQEEELLRVLPVIRALRDCGKRLSIDTMKPEIARAAVDEGATLINDVTGFQNPAMLQVAVDSSAFCCVMHMQKMPQTMQENPQYERGVVQEVGAFLQTQAAHLIEAGVAPSKIILDPGIGFGKSVTDNFELLSHVNFFKALGFLLLYGISRKSFLRKTLHLPTEELLTPTCALNGYLIQQGVDILRVHDVAAHRQVITLFDNIKY